MWFMLIFTFSNNILTVISLEPTLLPQPEALWYSEILRCQTGGSPSNGETNKQQSYQTM